MRDDLDYRKAENRQIGFTKFYQFMCETDDCSPDLAVENWLANELKYDYEQRCVMAFFHGAAYEGSTEVIMVERFKVMTPETIKDMIAFHDANFTDGQGLPESNQVKRLTRSPDAKHRWREPEFSIFMNSVAESLKPHGTLGNFIKSCFYDFDANDWAPSEAYKNLKLVSNYIILQQKCISEWKQWGRMGHWSFAEALHRFCEAPINPPTMEFAEGEGIRQGFAFCLNRDDLVEKATKSDILMLEGKAAVFLDQFSKLINTPKNVNRFTLETCCCNYKRQHKGSRYAGCYIDEQYDALIQMKKDWPEYGYLADKYLAGRQAIFPGSLLFENHIGEAGNDSQHAHIHSWNGALRDFGRMPRVEAYINGSPQRWTELDNMPFAGAGSNLMSLMT